jgi:hypothetical protein
MTLFYIFRSKPRFLKRAFLGGVYKTVFEFLSQDNTLKYLEKNIFRNSLIRAIDWYANYDIWKIKIFVVFFVRVPPYDQKLKKKFYIPNIIIRIPIDSPD